MKRKILESEFALSCLVVAGYDVGNAYSAHSRQRWIKYCLMLCIFISLVVMLS